LAAPVAAQDVTTQAPEGNWKIAKYDDKCRLSRTFGTGEDATRLIIEKGGTEPTFNLILIGERVSNPSGAVVSVQFGPDETAFGRTYATAKTRKGDAVILMYGASFTVSIPDEDGGYTIERLKGERLAAIEYLQIERARLDPFRLMVGNLSTVMESLETCTQALAGTLAVADTGESKQAEPKGRQSRWLVSADYPPMMVNYEQGGAVTYRLTVNKAGKPTFCTIISSTTPQMFDDTVCAKVLERAEFTPALDWEGNPKTSYWFGSVRFVIR